MTIKIIDIANRFLAEQACSNQELNEFKNWLSDPSALPEVEQWLSEHWDSSAEVGSNLLIEAVFSQIKEYRLVSPSGKKFSMARVVSYYQRIAAILLIPLLGMGAWFAISQYETTVVQYSETIAPRRQKSQIVLSDGTQVWLNSDTKIRYPGQFSKNQRDVYLEGEAFFKVTKNEHQPFYVHTSGPVVKVLGTKFNVKAYLDENQVETSLFEGSVDLVINGDNGRILEKVLLPGESIVYGMHTGQLSSVKFPKDEINGWKKNQLIFKDDTFFNLVKKIERWYNVEVIYDEKKFDDRRLTVELYEGERLEKLMDIISLALSVNYQYGKGKIILTPKNSKPI